MYKFKISDLTCMSCFHNIEEALKEKDPNVKGRADIKNQLLLVESSQSLKKLEQIIEESGYHVAGVTEE